MSGRASRSKTTDPKPVADSVGTWDRWAGSWPWLVVLLVLAFIAYSPALNGSFIWDDDDYVENNQTLRTVEGLWRIWCDATATPQYYPLVHSTFWVEYQLAGLTTTVYHVTNVVLHALSAWLLARLLPRLGIPGGLVASVVLALHPVAVESVAWITERKNVLSLVFYLLSFTCYWPIVEADHDEKNAGRWSPRFTHSYLLSLACFVAALLSKTVACSLPAGMLLLIYFKYGRITSRDLWRMTPFFLVGLPLAINTARLERVQVGAFGPEFQIPLVSRFIVAGRAVWFYLGKLIWPWPLAFSYERWNVEQPAMSELLYPISVVIVLGALGYGRVRLGRGPLVTALFFGGTLFPALGFINVFPFRYSFVADHFQYLAMLGPIVLFAAAVSMFLGRRAASAMLAAPPRKIPIVLQPLVVVTCLLALVLGSLTWLQAHDYRNLDTLYTNTLAKSPRAWLAWHNLGVRRCREGLPREAAALLERALELRPTADDAHANYGSVLFELDRFDEAREQFLRVLELWPDHLPRCDARVQAEMGLARLHLRAGEPDEAARYVQSLATNRSTPEAAAYAQTILARWLSDAQDSARSGAHRRLLDEQLAVGSSAWLGHAMACADLGDFEQAADAYLHVCKQEPDDTMSRIEAVGMLVQAGQLDKAREVADRLTSEQPTLSLGHSNLGMVLAMQSELPGAIAAFRRSLTLFPDSPEVRANLANALLQTGSGAEAINELRQAHELDSHNEAIARQCVWVMATHPDASIRSPTEALKIAAAFVERGQNDPRWLDVLAAAQAAGGDYSAAVKTAHRGATAATQLGAADLAQTISERERLFANGQAYVDASLQPAP